MRMPALALLFCVVSVNAETVWSQPYAVRISDDMIEAVIVPATGRLARLARLARVGGPNLLWQNPIAERCLSGWYNPGGDRIWPWPQSAWKGITGHGWPPPFGCDGPMTARLVEPNHVRIQGFLAHYGMRLTRDFTIANGRLRCTSRFEKLGVDPDPGPVAVWQITQLPPPERLEVLTSEPVAAAERASAWQTATVSGSILTLIPDASQSTELILAAEAIVWRAADGSGIAIRRIGAGGPAKIWLGPAVRPDASDAEPRSIELEFTSSEQRLAADGVVELTTELAPIGPDDRLTP